MARPFKTTGEVFDVGNLQMPYWLMNFEEHCEVFVTASGSERQVDADILAKCLIGAKMKNRLAADFGKLTVDSPIPYLLSDLLNLIQLDMGKLDRAGDTTPYCGWKTKIEEVKGDPRYSFMFSGMLVADTMGAFLGASSACPPTASRSRSSTCRGCPARSRRSWSRCSAGWCSISRSGRGNEPQRPILLVCEEATATSPTSATPIPRRSARFLSRIAKEGRKYGVSLGLITQRPS